MAKTTSKVTRKTTRNLVPGKTATASASTSVATLSEQAIAERAYLIYLGEGCPNGRHLEHWFQAQVELTA